MWGSAGAGRSWLALAGWLYTAGWVWIWSHVSLPPQTRGAARTEVQEPTPSAHAHVKSSLASHLSTSHWLKQVTWPSPRSKGREISFSHGRGGQEEWCFWKVISPPVIKWHASHLNPILLTPNPLFLFLLWQRLNNWSTFQVIKMEAVETLKQVSHSYLAGQPSDNKQSHGINFCCICFLGWGRLWLCFSYSNSEPHNSSNNRLIFPKPVKNIHLTIFISSN